MSDQTPPLSRLISRRRHLATPSLLSSHQAKPITKQDNDENVIVGIEIQGVEIYTLQGPIASDAWMTQTTDKLEDSCQPTLDSNNVQRRRRRLNLPEMVFPQAQVKIVLPAGNNNNNVVSLQWTALDSLQEWAQAHEYIGMGSTNTHQGVSVLKAIDAELWSSKQQQRSSATSDPTSSTDFYYDWTFSSPFCVKTTIANNNNNNNVSSSCWKSRDTSGINMQLLQDTTQPILYFDELQLYEDDLHDNGDVSWSCKLRVMPTCIFVLSRLWLRIDSVLLRIKETRLIVEFKSNQNGSTSHNNKVYRDTIWREAQWKDLASLNLPTDVRAWRLENNAETPAWQGLLNRLPVVELPPEIFAHAELEL